jgi:hypothetical protein
MCEGRGRAAKRHANVVGGRLAIIAWGRRKAASQSGLARRGEIVSRRRCSDGIHKDLKLVTRLKMVNGPLSGGGTGNAIDAPATQTSFTITMTQPGFLVVTDARQILPRDGDAGVAAARPDLVDYRSSK